MKEILEQIDIYIRSRFSIICIVTPDEERIINYFIQYARKNNKPLIQWDPCSFFKVLVKGDIQIASKADDPFTALSVVEQNKKGIFIFPDFHQAWGVPLINRKLRNLIQKMKYSQTSIIIITPIAKIPEELKNDIFILDLPNPDADELAQILKKLINDSEIETNISQDTYSKIINAALGLTANQAQRIFSKAIVSDGVLDENDIALINSEKAKIIKESPALEFYTPKESIADVGGLNVLKNWLYIRAFAFSRDAHKYGLPAPKGLVLVGIPGTGKSLTAKMVSNMWQLPLLRLDIGALFGIYIGQSEANTRQALKLAETISPCILWIDEIEKGLGQGGDKDGGTNTRVFSTILSWMQEKTKPVFVIATANNISKLPPELLRRGRFDEIFFLDLPTLKEREAIIKVHISKRNRIPDNYDIKKIAEACDGYVGAEIEQAIIDAMYIAFSDKNNPKREFTTDDILLALKKLVPMSISQKENISCLRAWQQEGRAALASSDEIDVLPEIEQSIKLEMKPAEIQKDIANDLLIHNIISQFAEILNNLEIDYKSDDFLLSLNKWIENTNSQEQLWHIYINENTYGPYVYAELNEEINDKNTLINLSGEKIWLPYNLIEEVRNLKN